jgi:hypothetical protein
MLIDRPNGRTEKRLGPRVNHLPHVGRGGHHVVLELRVLKRQKAHLLAGERQVDGQQRAKLLLGDLRRAGGVEGWMDGKSCDKR